MKLSDLVVGMRVLFREQSYIVTDLSDYDVVSWDLGVSYKRLLVDPKSGRTLWINDDSAREACVLESTADPLKP